MVQLMFIFYGLPMIGAWLVAQLHLLRDWMKEKVY